MCASRGATDGILLPGRDQLASIFRHLATKVGRSGDGRHVDDEYSVPAIHVLSGHDLLWTDLRSVQKKLGNFKNGTEFEVFTYSIDRLPAQD